ncbi:MAG: efflux RND transporter periplasmic adaptor subunit [Oleibacter sp.]|nr:efflux RND transporter periplasmic adaptor subunit [Thalassolituus sp.]
MKTNKVFIVAIVAGLGIGLAIGVNVATGLFSDKAASDSNSKDAANEPLKQEPLYWVAPMDANYKRDKPGKSPMGMDLIPVYQDAAENAGTKEGPGAVTIRPSVINNMGVRTAKVSRGTLNQQIETVGYVQYDEDRLVHIHPRVEGWIEKLYVKAKGDPVEKGQPLYTLYSPTLVNAQEEYLLALRRNNPLLISAAKERLMALQVPESDIKRVQSSGKVSQTVTIKAPQSGVLDYLDAREGMFVQPGIKMMSIGELEHLWVIGEIFERQLSQVKQGAAVTITLDYLPGSEWQGHVDYIYPSLSPDTRSAKVRIHVGNSAKNTVNENQLRPGMFAHLSINASAANEMLMIPSEALIRLGRQNGIEQNRVVLALGDGRFKSVAVTAGQKSTDKIEVLGGLNEGDEIVTSAQFLIDSESSKTSDFKRMTSSSDSAENDDHAGHAEHSMNDMTEMESMDSDPNFEPSSVEGSEATVDGVINAVNHQQGKLNITRGPITQWQRGEATLDFEVVEGINIHSFNDGDKVRFTFELRDGEFTILNIQKKAAEKTVENQHEGVHL